MKYNVIDIDPGMTYAPGDEVIAVVEAETGAEAIAKAMTIVGANYMEPYNPEGYAKYILAHAKAVPVESHRGDHRLAECQPCADVVEAMRWWLDDCTLPDGYEASSMDADEVISFVRNGYDGGIDQFLRDGDVN